MQNISLVVGEKDNGVSSFLRYTFQFKFPVAPQKNLNLTILATSYLNLSLGEIKSRLVANLPYHIHFIVLSD